ncbi:HNH endonuclease [Succinivibrio dextrinosolvens]|uniref:HNH endonuclease n=1 Tax=Succinivibrio dextrinosolvens TaxID=83771 RepID=UPI0008DF04B9|nr:HNH endonuclease [Succinivibrio dextrinosolvens]SFS84355.1 HNH endonuclease [Succinivibrio dextrinosolvens]
MQNDKSILVCKVSYNWYQVIKANFISNGSSYSNCWYTRMDEFNHDSDDNLTPAPGSMMLFVVERDGHQYIVGGGYYFTHTQLSPDDCWYRYGVRAGYLSYDSFINRIKECHGSLDEKLSCYIATASFIFVRSQMVKVPEAFMFNLENKSRFLLDLDTPLGRYLYKVSNDRRLSVADFAASDHTWPGIYYKAVINKSYDRTSQYKTALLSIYNRRCAVTGCTMVPALEVAHIKTMYDERYVEYDNGIILRADLHSLFSKGLMTFCYKGKNKIVVKLSNKMIEENAPYSEFEGVELKLPDDRQFWPNKEYLKWHNTIRFENWLKYGEFSLIDSVPMHPKRDLV